MVRPRPRPPWARSLACGVLHEQIEDARQAPRARCRCRCPDHGQHQLATLGARRTVMRPAGGVYLAALVSRFDDHLGQAGRGRPSTTRPSAGHVDVSGVAALLEQGAGHLDGLGHDLRPARSRSLAQLDLAAGDARDVQQVVDQPDQVRAPGARSRRGRASRPSPGRAAASAAARSGSATAGCAARGPAWPGTRPWPGWPVSAARCARPQARSVGLARAAGPAAGGVAHARQQLAGGERLDQVVVGAGLEPLDARLLAGARRQQDRPGRRAVAASARSARSSPKPSRLGIITSVRTRSGGAPARGSSAGRAVARRPRPCSCRPSSRAQVVAHVGVVVGDQDARAPSRAAAAAPVDRTAERVGVAASQRSASSTNGAAAPAGRWRARRRRRRGRPAGGPCRAGARR